MPTVTPMRKTLDMDKLVAREFRKWLKSTATEKHSIKSRTAAFDRINDEIKREIR